MPTLVDVPNVGQVEFPDEMPVEQVQGMVKKMLPQWQQQAKAPAGRLSSESESNNFGMGDLLHVLAPTRQMVAEDVGKEIGIEGDKGMMTELAPIIIRGANAVISMGGSEGLQPKERASMSRTGAAIEAASETLAKAATFLAPIGIEGVAGKVLMTGLTAQGLMNLPETARVAGDVSGKQVTFPGEKMAAYSGLGLDLVGTGLMAHSPVSSLLRGEFDINKVLPKSVEQQLYEQRIAKGDVPKNTIDFGTKVSPIGVPVGQPQKDDKVTELSGPIQRKESLQTRAEDEVKGMTPEEVAEVTGQAEETIKVPAIKQADGTVLEGKPGQIHNQIIADQAKLGVLADGERGFVTTDGRFVNREEGAKIMGQTEPLHSEDLPGYKQIPIQLKTPEKELQGRDMVLTGPWLARNAKEEIGFDIGKASPEQTMNRLQNLTTKGTLSSTELEVYKQQGLEEFLKTKPSGDAVAKWMEDNGPRVEINKKGEVNQNSEQQELSKLQHEWLDSNVDKTKISWLNNTKKGLVDANAYTYAYADAYAYAYAYANADIREIAKSKEYKQRFLEAKTPELKQQLKDQLNREILIKAEETKQKFIEKHGQQAKRFFELYDKYSDVQDQSKTSWSRIAPKPEDQMPGYVEGAVVVPTKKSSKYEEGRQLPVGIEAIEKESGIKFPSSHSFPPNTLGFFRGYMEGDTFHLIEAQTDVAYEKDKGVFAVRGHPELGDFDAKHKAIEAAVKVDPLLKDWERLTLKAAIDHAIKSGAKKIAVNDAETAMMTEGHDRYANRVGATPEDTTGIPQEKGMRLHYDQILPKLLRELTGSEGEKVGFGEHRMAFDDYYTGRLGTRDQELGVATPRKDLIFQEAGKPKTSITAKSFDLSKVRDRSAFSLFDKDKIPTVAAKSAPEKTSKTIDYKPTALEKRLGISNDASMGDIFRNILKNKETFTPQTVVLARFLDTHFSHILDFGRVDIGAHPETGGAAYQYEGKNKHTAYLDVKSGDVLATVLHEGAHAASLFVLENPKTAAQFEARAEIDNLMEQAIDSLPSEVKKFFKETYKPQMNKSQSWDAMEMSSAFAEKNLDAEKWHNILYALSDRAEFLAQVFNREDFRSFLNDIAVNNNKSVFRRVYDSIIKALGIKPGSALEKTFDSMMKLGKNADEEVPSLPTELEGLREGLTGVKGMAPGLPSPIKGRTWKQVREEYENKIAGWSAPKTMAADREVGNALNRYAAAKEAGPALGRALASKVLDGHWNDVEWIKKFGAALVQDRLNTIRQSFYEHGETEKGDAVRNVWDQKNSPFKSQAEVSAFLKEPDVKLRIQDHKILIEEPTTKLHEELGGRLAKVGEESGAFVNLKAMQDSEGEVVGEGQGGARKGNLTNPFKQGSKFNKQALGIAQEYDFDYRNIAQRMVQRNYEEGTKRELYKLTVDKGLGVVPKRGERAPEGWSSVPIRKQLVIVDKEGKTRKINQDQDLYLDPRVANEFRQALQTDSPVEQGARKVVLNMLTDAQLIGPTDVTVHLRQMFSAISGAQGGETALWDVMRKIPGIRGLDTIVRLTSSFRDIYRDMPETQERLAEIAKIGASKAEQSYKGSIDALVEKYPKLKPLLALTIFNKLSAKSVDVMNKAGRLTLLKMYDNLIERGLAKDTEEGRREFINKMGQYNMRVASLNGLEKVLKNWGVSPFIVAGKNFNRLALQRLMMNPGVEAANREAALKMRVVEALGLVSTLMAIPMTVNYYTTGSIWGRPGIQPGNIDLGTDDGKELDLVQNILVRRALRITGVDTAFRDMKQGKAESEIINDAFMDMVRGYAQPYEGPGVKVASIALTGYDTGGYLATDDPHNLGKKLAAALINANPSLAKYFQAKEEGTSKTMGLLQPLVQASGYSVGRKPTLSEKEMQVPGVEKLSLVDRAKLQTSLEGDKKLLTPKEKLSSDLSREQREQRVDRGVNEGLSKETTDWLRSQQVQVPGFQEYLRQTGVDVYLLPKEREEYMKVMVSSYEDAIAKARPFVERQTTQEGKQKVLAGFIKQAHGIARNKMRDLIGK